MDWSNAIWLMFDHLVVCFLSFVIESIYLSFSLVLLWSLGPPTSSQIFVLIVKSCISHSSKNLLVWLLTLRPTKHSTEPSKVPLASSASSQTFVVVAINRNSLHTSVVYITPFHHPFPSILLSVEEIYEKYFSSPWSGSDNFIVSLFWLGFLFFFLRVSLSSDSLNPKVLYAFFYQFSFKPLNSRNP